MSAITDEHAEREAEDVADDEASQARDLLEWADRHSDDPATIAAAHVHATLALASEVRALRVALVQEARA